MLTPCIEWTGVRFARGYGRTSLGEYAHRLAWEAEHGPIPAGMVVRHRCDNPPCVNVDHLQLGTQAENLADMVARGRARKADPRLVETIRIGRSFGWTFQAIATELGISWSTAWRHGR
jgi:hypothetical protein